MEILFSVYSVILENKLSGQFLEDSDKWEQRLALTLFSRSFGEPSELKRIMQNPTKLRREETELQKQCIFFLSKVRVRVGELEAPHG